MTKTTARPLRLLGVFAHPDDETFCIGGTLAKYVAQGAEAMVVSFTQGEAGQIRDAAVATRRTLGAKRAQELREACGKLGVHHCVCLDFGDGRMTTVDPELLQAEVVEIIRDFQPDLVFTFDDTGAYGHPDHIAVSRATTAAVALAGNGEYQPLGLSHTRPYKVARLYHSVFPDNGRLLLTLLVNWLKGLDTRFRGSDDFVHALMLFSDESTMLGYASDHIEVKWFPKGFYIIEQGEPATSLYLILSGTVDIHIENEKGEVNFIESHGQGVFLGEYGLAYGQPRSAHVVAAENVTCLVFSPGAPTNFAGRGEAAQFAVNNVGFASTNLDPHVCIDVTEFVPQKVVALSQHRTQYPIKPDMFPLWMMEELLGKEYFAQVYPVPQIATDFVF